MAIACNIVIDVLHWQGVIIEIDYEVNRLTNSKLCACRSPETATAPPMAKDWPHQTGV